MMAHRTLNTPEDVAAYEQYLDDGYPARAEVIRHICERLSDPGPYRSEQNLSVLELACGPGALAEAIVKNAPVTWYEGIDISQASLDYARRRVNARSSHGAYTKWLQADLNEDEWWYDVSAPFDAVVSMQALHDLGSRKEVEGITTIVWGMLDRGGRFIYADLLRQPDDAPDAHPGRLTVEEHVAMLQKAGLVEAHCTLETGGFGCFEAIQENTSMLRQY
jgi:cyclopropane fatty-acyl-phospholipid synthase-like methyltransferase